MGLFLPGLPAVDFSSGGLGDSREIGVQSGDDLRAFAYGAADALDRAGADITDGEDARYAGRKAALRRNASGDEARTVDIDAAALQPGRRRIGADKEEDVTDVVLRFSVCGVVPQPHALKA